MLPAAAVLRRIRLTVALLGLLGLGVIPLRILLGLCVTLLRLTVLRLLRLGAIALRILLRLCVALLRLDRKSVV